MTDLIIIGILIAIIAVGIIFHYKTTSKISTKELFEYTKLYYDSFAKHKKIPFSIYYINLARSTDRREFMEGQLADLAVKYKRIEAVDGRNITVNYENDYHDLKPTEIGCTLSHILAIQNAYQDNCDIAMICEDDAWLYTTGIVPPLGEIVHIAPQDWQILQLQTCTPSRKSFQNISSFEFKTSTKKRYWGSTCYLINKCGMKKILEWTIQNGVYIIRPQERNFPKTGTADSYFYDLATTYTLVPSIVTHNVVDKASTIRNDAADYRVHLKTQQINLENLLNESVMKQILFARTLLDLDDILRRMGQKYFLVCKTALGVVRENRFIPYVDDIDIGIFSSSYNPKVEEAVLTHFSFVRKLGEISKGCELQLRNKKTNIGVNIFIHYFHGPNEYWFPTFFTNEMYRRKVYIRKLSELPFLNKSFLIPSPHDAYLVSCYGEDWKVIDRYFFHKKY